MFGFSIKQICTTWLLHWCRNIIMTSSLNLALKHTGWLGLGPTNVSHLHCSFSIFLAYFSAFLFWWKNPIYLQKYFRGWHFYQTFAGLLISTNILCSQSRKEMDRFKKLSSISLALNKFHWHEFGYIHRNKSSII